VRRNGTAITHDAAGNHTADRRYTYKYTPPPENRLSQALDDGTLVAAYTYDFQGLCQGRVKHEWVTLICAAL